MKIFLDVCLVHALVDFCIEFPFKRFVCRPFQDVCQPKLASAIVSSYRYSKNEKLIFGAVINVENEPLT